MIDIAIYLSLSLDMCIKIYEQLRKQRDYEIIMKHLDDVHKEIQNLGAKLDEQTIRKAKTGLTHLVDGLNSEIEEVKVTEFQNARRHFSELIHLDPNGTTKSIDNIFLISIGYYGNFYYFNFHKDYKNALAQVYKCGLKCPDMAIRLFPMNFFSKNYLGLIETARIDSQSAMKELQKIEGANLDKNVAYYSKVGIAGLGLVAAGIFSFLYFPPLFLAVVKGGGQAINEFAGNSDIVPTDNLKKRIEQAYTNSNNLYSDLNNECNRALNDLMSISLEDLGSTGPTRECLSGYNRHLSQSQSKSSMQNIAEEQRKALIKERAMLNKKKYGLFNLKVAEDELRKEDRI
jgi:hypothetical protein